ncbi:SNF2-related protein [Bartonella queenslandensis]|uniref:SNF2-related protein n=1 Tax=Bartonella queenslandensis TaxID=481138 RepID=UPI0002E4E6D2|nr:SNF2-related protein [Bartonella queenslandensis]
MKQEKEHEPAKRESYTEHQATYLAHALTIVGSAEDNISKSLASAKVDMNPHQVEAALFALSSPLSHGVLLADEVGLGKTIEASLVIAQKWAERRRKILLIVPAMLRSQWSQELLEKFNLPSYVLESVSYKADKKEGIANPFNQDERVVICSYEFASSKASDLKSVQWDLVIFDEAHKLRNIWKDEGAKIAKTLQEALEGRKKILLSATPLQNSLLELYGLISVIDPHFFGNVHVFKMNYVGAHLTAQNLEDLQYRLSKICHRTLRRQVQLDGDINFTKRHSLVQEFYPFDAEKELYDKLSAFLQREDLFAIRPKSAHLTTLVIRKILASSSFAISGTLEKIIKRLETKAQIDANSLDDYENVVELFESFSNVDIQSSQNEESYGDENLNVIELFPDSSDEITPLTPNLTPLAAEIEELKGFRIIAGNIEKNAKGEALLTVLEKAFEQVQALGGKRKAVIFTESCRTQKYLKTLLEQNGYKGQIVLLNGTNAEPETVKIYQDWCQKHAGGSKISGSKTADMKAAIVEAFKDQAPILISTESGSEGVNLQFCSLLINYDLPWNPQRIEQRIGRVHRYGQKCDVVVVNFLNKSNKADQLVFNLLDQKFKLFEGVFGASDEILGAVESDISIESRFWQFIKNAAMQMKLKQSLKNFNKSLMPI